MNDKNRLTFVDLLPVTITWISITAQIVLTFVLWGNYYDKDIIQYIGYGLWVIGAIFGILPIFHFKRKGGVKKGDSYIKTTSLVTTGLYSIVRHPQYLAGIIISIALAFMSQHWVIIILVIPPIICTYFDTLNAEKKLIEKFGQEYLLYKKQVPRLYPVFGVIKLVVRKKRKKIIRVALCVYSG